ncbi:hypothetical protein BC835DRAFT_616767 [Cytidiella melzeri]|nr:hypothetical protein BC835DRAFT_616767 [Cytidiella melzeri]
MPVFNLTIDDTSPLIHYIDHWSDSNHADDYWSAYSNGTFHSTDVYGATATLVFNGSAVYLFGAFRPNHDVYSVTLDGNVTVANGNSNSTASFFQSVLFQATDLDTHQHRLVLQNAYTTPAPSYVDVDYVLVTSGDGNPDTQSFDTVLDDRNPNITYSSGWSAGGNSSYFNDSVHRSSHSGASAQIFFEGNAVTVYGTTSAVHAAFSVVLDGGAPLALNGSSSVTRFQNMLFYAGGLSNGSHTLTLTNVDTSGMLLDLDKVVVSKWGNWTMADITGVNQDGSSAAKINSSQTSTGLIIGGSILGIVLILTALGLLFLRRRQWLHGVDRVRTGALSKEEMFASSDNGIEPFTMYHHAYTAGTQPQESWTSVSEQAPSSRSGSGAIQTSVQVQSPTSQHDKSQSLSNPAVHAQAPSPSYVHHPDLSSFTTQTFLPRAGENLHQDIPPPNYTEATASSGLQAIPSQGRSSS